MNFKNDFDLFRKDLGVNGVALHQYSSIVSNSNIGIMNGYINPTVIEERQLNISQIDVFSRLMMDRIVFLGTGINDDVSNIITAQLLYLASVDATKPIDLYINSPGGSVYAGYSILDTMDFIQPDVNTMVCGMAASMAFILSISGKNRMALKHSRLMQHQPLGSASGQASDIAITAKQIEILKKELYEIISEKTGKPYKTVEKDCDRDYWMTASEALKYGAIDSIVQKQ